MKDQEAKEQIKLRGWAMQIDACNRSGLTVKQWCEENGVAIKTYYYHVKRVREEMLNTIEAGLLQVSGYVAGRQRGAGVGERAKLTF